MNGQHSVPSPGNTPWHGPLSSRRQTIRALAEAIRNLEQPSHGWVQATVSTGIPALDAVLPNGGFRPGGCVEWIANGPGCGVWSLALQVARHLPPGPLVLVDGAAELYPPALPALGIPLDRTWFVRPENSREALWAVERALRCSGVAAVFTALPSVSLKIMRRLQLAAERGGTLGVLVRDWAARRTLGFSHCRILVEPSPDAARSRAAAEHGWMAFRRVRLNVVRAGNRSFRARLTVELAHAFDRLHISAELADSAPQAGTP
ncbi:MAG: hypothetical protein D6725_14160 [Planctomycetota bacterium]|nr:MAG: hypothetical protein D6725_14160 [Planctomycetota bacterium]